MNRRDGEHDADGDQCDALKDAERARLETEHVLRVQRISHETDDRDDSRAVCQTALRARGDQDRLS